MAYAYAWTARVQRCYGLEEIGDDLFQTMCDEEGRAMLWAIRKLALLHGMKFQALEVERGTMKVRLTTREPICPENELFVARMIRGKGPHYQALLKDALQYAYSWELKEFDTEPMRELLDRVNRDIGAQRAARTPEDEVEIDKAMRFLLSTIGLKRADDPVTENN